MDERTVMIVLRLIHILSGVFWAGGGMVLAWFVHPANRASGESGPAFMRRLMLDYRLGAFFGLAMALTLLSGFGMYWRLSSLAGSEWFASRPAMVLGTGGIAAVLAAIIGMGNGSITGKKMTALGEAMKNSGSPPSAAQIAQMGALQGRLAAGARIASSLLIVATIAMAVARYL